MAVFKYKAITSEGVQITGTQEAASKEAVVNFLHQQNYVVVNIDEDINYFEEIFAAGTPNVSLKNRVIFAKQLATMLGAGLPITQVIEIIIQQTKDKALQKNLQAVLNDIQKSGKTLSESLITHTKMFNQVQVNLLKAGEASGNLHEVLVKIAQDLEKTKQLQARIKGAMIYPVIIFIVITVVMAVMMIYMIPAVKGLYDDFGIAELPPVTAALVAISNFLTNPVGFTILMIIIVSLVIGFKYYRATPGGRYATDKLILKIPVIGTLVSKIHIAEFARLLSMLLKSGIPIIDALRIISDALNNVLFKEVLIKAGEDLSKGIPLAVPLSRSEVYPPLIVRMVAIGEETGKLDSVLEDMAKFYDEEVQELSDNLNRLMEPLILVIVGGVVAFLAVGIYLPIYSIGQYIN